ncbi:MAG: winged helix-turn-helix domain-containing protein [Bacillota bacterium]
MARPELHLVSVSTVVEHNLEGWRVQPALNRVIKDETEVHVEPRVMLVFACLLAADGEPVTRDALLQQVWGHEYVTEHALNRIVSKLRRLIANELQCESRIETLPKTGYRLVRRGGTGSALKAGKSRIARRALWAAIPAAIVVALLAGFLARRSGQDVATDVHARLLPFTTLGGMEILPAFSPDGGRVAFVWRARPDGNYHVYVRPIGADSLLQLTTGAMDDFHPAWSPAGDQIAYVRERPNTSCEILSVSSVGGPARHVADCDKDYGGSLAWSPDGRVLAMRAPGSKGLDFLTLADGTLRHVTTVPPSEMLDDNPTFSPDGTQLAFVRWHATDVDDVYVQPLAGGPPRRLTFDNVKVHGVAWEPDGRHLVFSSNRGGPFGLWRVGTDGGAPEPVPMAGHQAYSMAMSRDGRRLVYQEWNGQVDLFTLDTRTPGALPQQVTFTTRSDWSPAVSTDGRRIAFVSDRAGFNEIWVADFDGGNSLKLTAFGGPYIGNPAWSPDGRELVFDAPAVDGNFDIYAVDAAGGAPRRLTTDAAEDRFPHFSPDGSWIYFSSRRSGAWEIWRMPATGGDAEQVTFKGGYYSQLTRDGTVYFTRIDQPGIWRVMRGGDPELVVPDLEPADSNNWYPGPDRLWYAQQDAQGRTYLASHGYSPGPAGQRFAPIALLNYRSGLSLAPDGRLLFAGFVRSDSDLMLLQE